MTQPNNINEQLVLISGESASGKSFSLKNIPNQEKWVYLNCEAGKRLPFKNQFKSVTVTDPFTVHKAFDEVRDMQSVDGIIIDSLTFLMDMFESKYVLAVKDKMQGWSNYQQFFKTLMQEKIASSPKAVLVLAHTRTDLNENTMEMQICVPIKGALKNNGIEAYFSTVVSTKKKSLTELAKYDSDLLTISERDEMLGFKHVFQTQLTKETLNERIRSPDAMFTVNQTYMNNDAELLLKHLREYYT